MGNKQYYVDALHARYTSEVHMACLVALNVSLRLHFYVLFLLGEQRLGNYEIREHDWHLPVARS